MIKLLNILILLCLVSCGQNQSKSSISIRENNSISLVEVAIIYNSLEIVHDHWYLLTEKELKIISTNDSAEERDSVLFSVDVQPCEIVKNLSDLNLDNLKEYYENPCIEDGSQLKVRIRKNNKSKDVYLSNYYQNDIGLAIELVNDLAPEKYKILYDKDKLLQAQKECDEQTKITDDLQLNGTRK